MLATMSAPATGKLSGGPIKTYRPVIQGLRALAVLMMKYWLRLFKRLLPGVVVVLDHLTQSYLEKTLDDFCARFGKAVGWKSVPKILAP